MEDIGTPVSPDDGSTAEQLIQRHITDVPLEHDPIIPPQEPDQPPDENIPLPSMLRVFTYEEFLQATEADEDLAYLSDVLLRRQAPNPSSLPRKTSLPLQSMLAERELYSIKKGLLYRQIIKESSSTFRLVVPNALQAGLAAKLHIRFGHPGITSTVLTVQRGYWFHNLRNTVRRMVNNCSICLKYKSKTDKSFIGVPLDSHSSRPWETIAMDHLTMGQSPHLKAVYTAVLLAVDVFSGFVVAENVKSLDAFETISAVKRIIEHYGSPQTIRTDNATSFKNQNFTSFLRSFGITHVQSLPYTPTSNGKAERHVQSLKNKLRILLATCKDVRKWHHYTKTAAAALNNTIRPAVGYSPREVFLGAPPFIDGTFVYADPSSLQGNVAEYVAQREEFFNTVNRKRWGLIDKSRPRSTPPTFSPGQKCFIRNFLLHLTPEKNIQQKFLGPFTISKKISATTYLVDRPGQVAILVHVNNIRPFWPELDPVQASQDNEIMDEEATAYQRPPESLPTDNTPVANSVPSAPNVPNAPTEHMQPPRAAPPPSTRPSRLSTALSDPPSQSTRYRNRSNLPSGSPGHQSGDFYAPPLPRRSDRNRPSASYFPQPLAQPHSNPPPCPQPVKRPRPDSSDSDLVTRKTARHDS